MRALMLNASLKPSPEPSSAGALSEYVGGRLAALGAEVEHVRLADHVIEPGVVSEAVREGDGWPALHARVLAADIVVFGTPTWVSRRASSSRPTPEPLTWRVRGAGPGGDGANAAVPRACSDDGQ